jgi:hypothetical protein
LTLAVAWRRAVSGPALLCAGGGFVAPQAHGTRMARLGALDPLPAKAPRRRRRSAARAEGLEARTAWPFCTEKSINPLDLSAVLTGVGEYHGLAGLRLGFAAVFTLRAPRAKDGPSDIFFARIGRGDGDDQDDRRIMSR